MDDQITLTGLRVFGRHGVLGHERRDGQHFIVDLSMTVDASAAGRSDDVGDTVHYGEVAERVAQLVGGEPVNLIETLAVRIAEAVLAGWPVRAVTVTVHKPEAPIEVPFDDVAVTVTRGRT
ncbi:dihydroneopterin aldolase [Microbacterium awajiense]|uniref:7,8-dihydroneopterin aldolase n=1 Tax=Microbacterium awajiense TaxID=415214 RepID=A0ABP7AMA4_9MICO